MKMKVINCCESATMLPRSEIGATLVPTAIVLFRDNLIAESKEQPFSDFQSKWPENGL
jgi:hypothetical protein